MQPGIYNVVITYAGFDSLLADIAVSSDTLTVFNCKMKQGPHRDVMPHGGYRGHPLVTKYGDLSGQVFDTHKKQLRDAVIYFYSGGSLSRSKTESNGFYLLRGEVGDCNVVVAHTGYDTVVLMQVPLQNKTTVYVNFTLHKTGRNNNGSRGKRVCTFDSGAKASDDYEQYFSVSTKNPGRIH